MKGYEMDSLLAVKLGAVASKVIAVVIGGVMALVFSGDIDVNGKLQITWRVIAKLVLIVMCSLYGGAFTIEFKHWQSLPPLAQGFVYLVWAVFGMLSLGILYRAIQKLNGKSLSEIAGEISQAYAAVKSNLWGK